jgi:hypothetical protein
MKQLAIILALGFLAGTTQAAPAPFTGQDVSGVYDCKGLDSHEGPYDGVVTMQLIREQSTGEYGSYSFKLEVPGYGTYLGHAAVRGQHAAIHFALTDPAPKDYGTGIAEFSTNEAGKLTFHKFYYEPEFKGGNYGMEDCAQR